MLACVLILLALAIEKKPQEVPQSVPMTIMAEMNANKFDLLKLIALAYLMISVYIRY